MRKYLMIISIKFKIVIFLSSVLLLNSAMSFGKDLYPIAVNDKVGYIDSNGTIIITPEYETIIQYYNIPLKERKLKGVKFPKNAFFSDGLATIRNADYFLFIPLRYHYGLIDSNGKKIPLSFDIEIGTFKDGLAPFRAPKKHFQYVYENNYGYINTHLQIVIQPQYQWCGHFSEGLALVLNENKYGYIDSKDSMAVKPLYVDGTHFSEGLAAVATRELYGYINKSGDMVIPEQFVKAWEFNDGIARIHDGSRFGFIDKSGNKLFNNTFAFAGDFSEGLAKVIVEGNVGFIDNRGLLAIPDQFDNTSDFQNGSAAVELNGKWGFIDKSGMFILPPIYDYANNFQNGLAQIWLGEEMWYINLKGEKISRVFWDDRTFLWW